MTQDQKASYDFNDMDADPKPRDSDPDNWYVTHAILMARSQKLTESLSTKRTATVDHVAFVLLTTYILISVCTFSILFSIRFLRC